MCSYRAIYGVKPFWQILFVKGITVLSNSGKLISSFSHVVEYCDTDEHGTGRWMDWLL